jgi:hypothetical protein
MPRTYFKDFTRDNGQPVTVEYQMEGETCACVVAEWPNTEEYNRLVAERMELEYSGPYGKRASVVMMDPDIREKLQELDGLIEALDETARLSDSERERMERWLSENYIQESDEVEF